MKRSHRRILAVLGIVVFTAVGADAIAAVSITGTVGATGKYSVTSVPITGKTSAVFKMVFENRTEGTNLVLCAGTTAEFNSGACPRELAKSGGPGYRFLAIIDMATISGHVLYVKRLAGNASSAFELTVE